jgi:prolyl-tRNA editing enzyme YbaK/EbsC (Cys-tRNA(Pro) deacylase)
VNAIDVDLVGMDRLRAALIVLKLDARIVSPGTPMPTVPLAAAAVGCADDQIIKTVVFATPDGQAVIAIANGTRRIDRRQLASAAQVASLKLAQPDFVLDRTGYPAGGVSPIGIRDVDAPVIVDSAVLGQRIVFGGAGTENDLLEIETSQLLMLTGACVCPIVRED